MPPKKSSNKKSSVPADLWYHCNKCDVHITYKEREAHEDVCPIPQEAPLEYIRNGIIYTTEVERQVFEVEELKEMPPKYVNNLLFMSEGAMRLAGFHIGQQVAIHTLERPDEPVMVRAVWPLAEKFLITPYVTKEDFDLNWKLLKRFTVKIHALPNGDTVKPAKVLNLNVVPSDIPLEFDEQQYKNLAGVLKQEFKNTVHTLGSRLQVTFFNKSILLNVREWSYFDSRSLIERLQNLNITKRMGEHFFKITGTTRIEIENKSVQKKEAHVAMKEVNIGGLVEEIALVEHTMECALSNEGPKGSKISRGILLYGPPGCGKSMILDLLRNNGKIAPECFITINTGAIYSKFLGETEKNLAGFFEAAYARYPQKTIIVIEDIHNLCPKDEPNEITKRVSVAFLSMLDTLNTKKEGQTTCLIATTSEINALSPSIRRCGRFDMEIEIGPPKPSERFEILKCLLMKVFHNLTNEDMEKIAKITHGFVGADLANLIYKASLKVVRLDQLQTPQQVANIQPPEEPPAAQLLVQLVQQAALHLGWEEPERGGEWGELELGVEWGEPGQNRGWGEQELRRVWGLQMRGRWGDLEQQQQLIQRAAAAAEERAEQMLMPPEPQPLTSKIIMDTLAIVKPSAMREVLIENPNVLWADIGGQAELKLKLKQIIEWPLLYPDKFKQMGIKAPRGLLMFGPPGCSKTMMAKAIATETRLNFLSIKGPELFSMWVGESERAVRDVFRKARQVAPSVVFFDEIDAIGGERSSGSGGSGTSVNDRVLTQLLTELDGVEALENVIIIAATNRPDMIDRALMRPGRIDRMVYVGLPDFETRQEIFRIKLNSMSTHHDIDIHELTLRTEGYSCAEIVSVCQEAGLRSLQEDFEAEHIDKSHFLYALQQVPLRTNPKLLEIYKQFY